MPDNNSSAAQPEPEASTGEFDFAKSGAPARRMKRRSLKPQTQPVLKPLSRTPGELVEPAADTAHAQEPAPARTKSAPALTTRPASSPAEPGPRIASTTNPSSSPHGTRPATLYYSSTPRKDKEEPTPMKSTTTPTPASSSSATSPVSSTVSRTTTTASVRPSSISDYRTNAERQAREQKSVGNILAYLVYTLIAFFVIGAALAGYGAYVVSKQLHQQSVTVDDLDARLTARSDALEGQLKTTMTTLSEAQSQIARQQELILKQQETINKLIAAAQDNAAAIRTERAARAGETASLRARVKDLEYKGPITQRY
ncbi:MAG: hypothetical protein LV479_01725 [Methylacidiphilales bacterium]|nr:hypothetical protein [Candidatus Methylacidiphilales bacterium]